MRKDWDIDADRGLWLFRATRLEALVAPLDALLTHLPPAALLAPQTVLVGHPGLRPWLRQQLAARRGPRGIVANLEFALPSPWLDRLARALGGEALLGVRPWAREVLRWRLWQALPTLSDARVETLLAADATGAERWALAETLAAALVPLLVYRLDWLQAWERGARALPSVSADDEAVLAAAWRALRMPGLPRHRGEGLRWLIGRLREAAPGDLADAIGADDGPLHVFGLNHLPPLELAVLQALSRHRAVVVHALDPCAEDWLGMRGGRRAFRDALAAEDLGEASFLALEHPLLAAWARLGQHFLLGLENADIALQERAGEDAADADRGETSLLARLQRSLRRNDPTLIAAPPAASVESLEADASLRIHACATPLRELEVLRDALAQAFIDRPDLQPADVVVMAPRLDRYRALVPAVFGEPARRDGRWPWRIADVPLSATHPLYLALREALALPDTRLTAPGVIDLLQAAPVARRFGLEGRDTDTLASALSRLGVAWGFDGADRTRFDLPRTEAHTFAWGLDRALAGQVFGSGDDDGADIGGERRVRVLPDGARIVPGPGIDGAVADILGRAHALLLELREWIALGGQKLDGETWSVRLSQRITALFDGPGLDDAAREALDNVRRSIAELQAEWRDAGVAAPLPFAAVRAALLAKLDAVPERQRFLEGGITFCGMVPQRAIPFRVVAVLGLDDGALPRTADDAGLDLRRRHPRAGDRDLALDDRYLFLETVMAARDRLHLSFVGLGVQDGGERNPATPLAELHATLRRFAGTSATWWHSAPLQPRGGSAHRRTATEAEGANTGASARGVDATANSLHADRARTRPATTVATDAPRRVEPAALGRFFRDPARVALRDGLGVRLDGLDDSLDADEPLSPRPDRRDALARTLALAALARGTPPPEAPPEPLTLAGRLPAGDLGATLWRSERTNAVQLLQRIEAEAPLPVPLPTQRVQRVALDLDGLRIEGPIPFHAAGADDNAAAWVVSLHPARKSDQLHFGDTLPPLLHWMLLRLHRAGPVRLLIASASGPHPWSDVANAIDAQWAAGDDAQRQALRQRIARTLVALVDFRDAVLRGERRYLPKTSHAAYEGRDEATRSAWVGGDHGVGERDYAPGYAALWARDWGIDDEFDASARNALGVDARALLAALASLTASASLAGTSASTGHER